MLGRDLFQQGPHVDFPGMRLEPNMWRSRKRFIVGPLAGTFAGLLFFKTMFSFAQLSRRTFRAYNNLKTYISPSRWPPNSSLMLITSHPQC